MRSQRENLARQVRALVEIFIYDICLVIGVDSELSKHKLHFHSTEEEKTMYEKMKKDRDQQLTVKIEKIITAFLEETRCSEMLIISDDGVFHPVIEYMLSEEGYSLFTKRTNWWFRGYSSNHEGLNPHIHSHAAIETTISDYYGMVFRPYYQRYDLRDLNKNNMI